MLTPKGFSPEYRPKGVQEGEHLEDDRVYAQPAKLPLPIEHPKDAAITEITSSWDCQEAAQLRPNNCELCGYDDDGYTICRECGGNWRTNGLPSST